jgi:hypothetical protein
MVWGTVADLRLYQHKDIVQHLLAHPAAVLLLCCGLPLLEGIWGVNIDNLLCKRVLQSEGEELEVVRVVHGNVCTEHIVFKVSDVLVNVALLHLELLEPFLGMFVFSIINKHLDELLLKCLPDIHPVRKKPRVALDLLEPYMHAQHPPLDLRALNKPKEVGSLPPWVTHDASVVIHDHEPFELGEEDEGLAAIPVNAGGGIPLMCPLLSGLQAGSATHAPKLSPSLLPPPPLAGGQVVHAVNRLDLWGGTTGIL